jgi:hypothetical protein
MLCHFVSFQKNRTRQARLRGRSREAEGRDAPTTLARPDILADFDCAYKFFAVKMPRPQKRRTAERRTRNVQRRSGTRAGHSLDILLFYCSILGIRFFFLNA